jgi:hypothetical protein
MTHAVLALGQLRIEKAIQYNPLVLFVVFVSLGYLVPSRGQWRRQWTRTVQKYRLDWAGLICLMGFWVWRIVEHTK